MSKNTGGPAFARPRSADPEEFLEPETYHAQEGMTLRDHFAAKAMQGIIAGNVRWFDWEWTPKNFYSTDVVIMVEDIVTETDAIGNGYHEAIADNLHQRFGGRQILTAHHHGVDILTRRGGE